MACLFRFVILIHILLIKSEIFCISILRLIVQNAAKENAPYLTGTLRRSISTDFDKITQWVVIVWSPVVYARRREYENYLHPERKFYLKRAYTENKKEILDIVRKYLSDWLD